MEKKSGLGKGLSAIFGEKSVSKEFLTDSAEQKNKNKFIEIEIENLNFNRLQPRENINEEKLQELVNSIKERGVIQAVTVKPSSGKGKFDLISGERRVRAALKAGLEKIPAYILDKVEDNTENLLELALIENIQREDLNPMELSNAYQKLIDECQFTQEQIAAKVYKQRSTVANFLRLQKLPEKIKESLRKNEITEAHARLILRVNDDEEQLLIWKRIIEENLTVKKLDELTKPHSKGKKKQKIYTLEKITGTEEIENKLRLFFGTKVTLKPRKNKSGEIIIEYYSDEDLERILEICEK
ncbi:MAG: ParB/RepB/Spo0J family partition protein [Ignavibacteria bacterium]|nr:ParB/RepB/Spo0J family partition protein [Ignavibacteria bacterium]